MKIIKCFVGAFIVALGFVFGLMSTGRFLYRPLLNGIKKIRGTMLLEGEELGSETFFIVFGILFPLFYLLSFGVLYKWLSTPLPKSAPLDALDESH
jgi:hypothetical protein